MQAAKRNNIWPNWTDPKHTNQGHKNMLLGRRADRLRMVKGHGGQNLDFTYMINSGVF